MINASAKTVSCQTIKRKSTDTVLRESTACAGLRLCILAHGNALWQINEKQHDVQAGDIVFLNSRQKRRFLNYGTNGCTLIVLTLERQAFSSVKHFSFFLTCIQKKDGILKDETLARILLEITDEFQNRDQNYELISALLTEFFIKAERLVTFDEKSIVKIDKNMLKILDYIDEHITEKISLAEISKTAGFTESSFSRWFAKCNGISFKKYVMGKKIEHAVYLLENTEQKVIDIAFECGFDSISGFYDTFKKVTGTTPNKFTYIV